MENIKTEDNGCLRLVLSMSDDWRFTSDIVKADDGRGWAVADIEDDPLNLTGDFDVEGFIEYVERPALRCTGTVLYETVMEDEGEDIVVVADSESYMAGCMAFAIQHMPGYIPPSREKTICDTCWMYMRELYVNPEFRGHGLATLVLNSLPKLVWAKYGLHARYMGSVVPSEENTGKISTLAEKTGYSQIYQKESDCFIYLRHFPKSNCFIAKG